MRKLLLFTLLLAFIPAVARAEGCYLCGSGSGPQCRDYCRYGGADTFDARKDLPATWAGLQGDALAAATGVPDAVFCHNNLFIAACKSYDGMREMARQALAA